jgi:hypothetical protein
MLLLRLAVSGLVLEVHEVFRDGQPAGHDGQGTVDRGGGKTAEV